MFIWVNGRFFGGYCERKAREHEDRDIYKECGGVTDGLACPGYPLSCIASSKVFRCFKAISVEGLGERRPRLCNAYDQATRKRL